MPISSKRPSEPLSVLIVGCGRIAGGYDQTDGPDVKTHAKAYLGQGCFRLAACVDPDRKTAETFAARWGVERSHATLQEAKARYDVVSLCSPPEAHADQLATLLDWDIGLVFCEKPLTDDIEQSRRLVAAYREKARPLVVNYQRRWEPFVCQAREEIAGGRWGKLLSAQGIYTKGVFANGSHLVDLLQFLIGPLTAERVFEARTDYSEADPSLGALLRSGEGAPVILSIGDTRHFTIFELDLLFEQGRITFADSGWTASSRRIVDDARYANYRILEPALSVPTRMAQAMSAAIASLHDNLTSGTEPPSTGATALAAQEVCHRLLQLKGTLP